MAPRPPLAPPMEVVEGGKDVIVESTPAQGFFNHDNHEEEWITDLGSHHVTGMTHYPQSFFNVKETELL